MSQTQLPLIVVYAVDGAAAAWFRLARLGKWIVRRAPKRKGDSQ
jgi:hypothetical protein